MSAADFVAVDDEMGPLAAAQFALAMTRVDGDNGLTCGVPISDLAVHWDKTRADAMFQHIKQDDTAGIGKDLCTASGLVAGSSANEPPISWLRPTKVATTVSPLLTSTS